MATAVVFKYHWKTCQNRWKMAKFQKVGHIWKRQRQASLKNSNFAILGQFQGDFVFSSKTKSTWPIFCLLQILSKNRYIRIANSNIFMPNSKREDFGDSKTHRLFEIWPILADFMANSFRKNVFYSTHTMKIMKNRILQFQAKFGPKFLYGPE